MLWAKIMSGSKLWWDRSCRSRGSMTRGRARLDDGCGKRREGEVKREREGEKVVDEKREGKSAVVREGQ